MATKLPVMKHVDAASGSKSPDKAGSDKKKRSGQRQRSYTALKGNLSHALVTGGEYLGGNALGHAYAGYRARSGKPVPKFFGVDARLFLSAVGIVGSLWNGKQNGCSGHLLNASLGLGSSWTGEQATRAGAWAAEKWGGAAAPAAAAGVYIGHVGAAEDRRERRAARVDRRIQRLEAKKAKYDAYDEDEDEDDNEPRRVIVIRPPVQQAQGRGQGVNVRSPVHIRRPAYQ